jgi:hypothetical protein
VAREAPVGPNAYCEQLEPGRPADCYLGILLDQPLAAIAPGPGRMLVVAPPPYCSSRSPARRPSAVRAADRSPRPHRPGPGFLADLTVELRAWPQQTWTTVGITPPAALLAALDRWRAGHVKGLEVGRVSADEARALARPAMTYVREQLRARLAREVSRQHLR